MTYGRDQAKIADKQYMEIGRRFIVLPPGESAPDTDRLPLYIDPGKAFGAGDHPSTQLCLNALARHLKPGMPVLDLGTGTGILAIAAAKLGSGPVLGVDIEDESIVAARRNVALNQVEDRVRIEQGSLDAVLDNRFDMAEAPLVVANILSAVLISFLEAGLANTLSDGGLLMLAGILRSQTPHIRAGLSRAGLAEAAQETMGEWACVIARKSNGQL